MGMKVAIIGAGISGLTTAFYLSRLAPHCDITIYETLPQSGGKLATIAKEGFLIEMGANGFLSNKEEMWQLIHDLDADDTVISSSDAARKRFIFTTKLYQLPETPQAFFKTKLLSFRAKIRVLCEFFIPAKHYDDEQLQEFGYRRLGREFTDVFLDAMTAGVFASSPSKLSINAAFPTVAALEHTHGGLFKGMFKSKKKNAGPGGVLTSFKGGVGQLIKRLDFALEKAHRYYGVTVENISYDNGQWHVHADNNTSLTYDTIVLATPSFISSSLLQHVDNDLALTLKRIEYSPAALVALGYNEELTHSLDGFGLLTTASSHKPILGALWDSSVFEGRAPEGKKLIRVIIGGQRNPELVVKDEEELISIARDGLRQTMALTTPPYLTLAQRWYKAIPNYNVGHLDLVKTIFSSLHKHKGLYLCSNAYKGVSMNDCVKNAKLCAEAIILQKPL